MSTSESKDPLYRQEAIDHHLLESEWGALLRISPAWQAWAYRCLVGIAVAALAFLFFGTVPVYESGPALLRVGNVMPLKSSIEGTIASVEVVPGQHVREGETVVVLRQEQETAQLTQVEKEFELQLLARLRDPNDAVAEQELRRLRPELERARASADRMTIRASREGAVQDVRIQPGDFLHTGDQVLSLIPDTPEFSVVAFLPGQALPQLQPGMEVRLRIAGYAYAYVTTRIESVGRQVIGPAEARRFAGAEIGDTLELSGPVVVVRSRLQGDRFVAWKQEYRVHDGMRAIAEIQVRRERLIERLLPDLGARGPREG
jgi:membrane fusion protein (multidrug efflux system)